MVDWKFWVGIPIIVIGAVIFVIYLNNQQEMKEMLKQEECIKFDMMGYINNGESSPEGEFCTKDNELYPVHFECKKKEGTYGCEMFFIGWWNKLMKVSR